MKNKYVDNRKLYFVDYYLAYKGYLYAKNEIEKIGIDEFVKKYIEDYDDYLKYNTASLLLCDYNIWVFIDNKKLADDIEILGYNEINDEIKILNKEEIRTRISNLDDFAKKNNYKQEEKEMELHSLLQVLVRLNEDTKWYYEEN